ncbi:dTDP-4-dehydrorhamnose reductase [Bradyrhizobium sp. BRP14]|nr:dTDP-4-dehydrorhamnose reductase [Bradyrhizobium sp. BRP14]
MRLAVTGKNGQIALALKALARPDVEILTLGRPNFDLARRSTVASSIRDAAPDIIVSLAAYTAVDKAESEPYEAFAVNRDGVQALAEAAAGLGVPVIHLSTDYVFDGTKPAPYYEEDRTGPISVYGRSKLEGEFAVASANPNHTILRTSWVYSRYGQNFVKKMLRLADTNDELNVVADQIGCPTSADDISVAVMTIARRMLSSSSADLRGIFHLSGSGEASWAAFAKYVFSVYEEITGRQTKVHDISAAEYPTPARRPANSRLHCDKLERTFGIRLPNWEESTRRVVWALLLEGKDA